MIDFLILTAPSVIWTAWMFYRKKEHPLDGLYTLLATLALFALVGPGLVAGKSQQAYLWLYCLVCTIGGLILGWLFHRSPDRKKTAWMTLAGVLILTYLERFVYFFMDIREIEAVEIARTGFSDIIRLSGKNLNPPLYFWLLKGWISVFGESSISLSILGAIPFIGTGWLGIRWFWKNRKESMLLFILLTFLLPISMSNSYRIWGFGWSALLCLGGLVACYDRPLNWKNLTVSLVFMMAACLFHYGALIPALAWTVYLAVRIIRDRKWGQLVIPLILLAWTVLVLGYAASFLSVHPVPGTMLEKLEETAPFSYFFSIFSGWEEGQWPYIFNGLSILFILLMLLKPGRKEAGFYWTLVLFAGAAMVTILTPFVISRYPAYFVGIDVQNNSFLVIDRMIWFTFPLLAWMVWKKKEIMHIICAFALVTGLVGCYGLIEAQQQTWINTEFSVSFMEKVHEQGYEFIMVNDRGNVGYDSQDNRRMLDWYGPDNQTGRYMGENISRLDYSGHKYAVLSAQQLRTGIKRILDSEGIEWKPLGIIRLPARFFYIYVMYR